MAKLFVLKQLCQVFISCHECWIDYRFAYADLVILKSENIGIHARMMELIFFSLQCIFEEIVCVI